MAIKQVFVVMGQCGEYSDKREWPVAAFAVKEVAEAFEFGCTQWAKKNALAWDDQPYKNRVAPAHDPSFSTDYTSTDYYTMVIDVVVDPPEFAPDLVKP